MRRAAGLAALALLLGGCGAPPEPRSVVLIVVDTLRADHLGLYGYGRPTSPELDRLAESAAVFERAYATSPWTLPSFGSLFTGRLPAEHLAGSEPRDADGHEAVARGFLGLREGVDTLAETLGGAGLETAAVMSNAFLNPVFGVARGFDTYDHVAGNRKRIRRADEVVDRALEWAGTEGRGDFLLVVHFFDPHLDYDPPAAVSGRFGAGLPEDAGERTMDLKKVRGLIRKKKAIDWDYLTAAYDEEILFVDGQIGRLFEGLEQLGRLDSSLVVLTADHGEELFDHGGFEHGHALWDEVVRIPLAIWGPGVEAGRHDRPVSLIDVYPTVLEALGLPPQMELPGRSLVGALRGEGRLPERTLIAERTLYGSERQMALRWPYKLIHDPKRGERALFNLAEDPRERQSLARLRSDIADRLLADLDAHARHAATVTSGTAVEPDEETLESLRSLGYIQ